MSDQPSVTPFAPSAGRKYYALSALVALGMLIMVSVYLKTLVPALHRLDIVALERIYGVIALNVGLFMGVNGYITGKVSDPPGTVPADKEVVPVTADEDV